MADVLFYNKFEASTNAFDVGNAADTVYMGLAAFTDASRRCISKVAFKLTKQAGSITSKTYRARIWLVYNSGSSPTTVLDTQMAVSDPVTGSDAWSLSEVNFTFPTPFWTDAGSYYAITIDANQTHDASNYARGYFVNAALYARGAWRAALTNFIGQSTYNPQIKIYTTDTPPTAPWTEYKGTIDSQAYRVLVPPTPNGNGILAFHSAGQNQYFSFWSSIFPTTYALLAAGYTVAESYARGDNWGNNASKADYVSLAALMRSDYAVNEIGFLCASMGGVASQTLLADGTISDVVGWAGTSAVCSLVAAAAAGFSASISTAYGGGSYAANDPLQIAASGFTGEKMRWWASPADVVITKAANSDAMSARVAAYVTEGTVIATSGAHGAAANFDAAATVAWLETLFTQSSGSSGGIGGISGASGISGF